MTSLIFLSRAFISGAFQCAYVYTPEVYPTTLRAAGLGAASAMARLGAIVTPFVAQVLSGESLSLPIGVYGTAALLGAIASISLPIETKGRKMTVCSCFGEKRCGFRIRCNSELARRNRSPNIKKVFIVHNEQSNEFMYYWGKYGRIETK